MTVMNNNESLERVAYSVFHRINTQWETNPSLHFYTKLVTLPQSAIRRIAGAPPLTPRPAG